jgi:hypothetical protein
MTDELDRRGVVKRLVELVSQRVPAERLAAAARAG